MAILGQSRSKQVKGSEIVVQREHVIALHCNAESVTCTLSPARKLVTIALFKQSTPRTGQQFQRRHHIVTAGTLASCACSDCTALPLLLAAQPHHLTALLGGAPISFSATAAAWEAAGEIGRAQVEVLHSFSTSQHARLMLHVN